MTKQITLEQALCLVDFDSTHQGDWYVSGVKGNIFGNVTGSVQGQVDGKVWGTINGRRWEYIETPKQKLERLIIEGADRDQLIEAFNQLEDNQ